MKINGAKLSKPEDNILVIPRQQSDDIIIKAQAVLDFDDFEKICPPPVAPERLFPDGRRVLNVEDSAYKEALNTWGGKKTDWMVIKSLDATDGLEWDTVDLTDSDTWSNWRDELSAVFTPMEVNKIFMVVVDACGLNQEKIDKATQDFLAGQGQE